MSRRSTDWASLVAGLLFVLLGLAFVVSGTTAWTSTCCGCFRCLPSVWEWSASCVCCCGHATQSTGVPRETLGQANFLSAARKNLVWRLRVLTAAGTPRLGSLRTVT